MWALTWINQNLTNGNLGEPGFFTSPFWKQEADYRIVFKIMKSVLFQSFSKMKLAPALKIIGPVKFYEIKIFLFLTSLSVNLGASKIKLLVSLKILVNRDSSVWVASRTHPIRFQLSSRQTVFQFVRFRFFVSLDACSFLFWCLCFLPWLSILHSKTVLPASILIAASAEVGEDSKTLMLSTRQQFRVRKVGYQWTTHLVHCEPPRRHTDVTQLFTKTRSPGWWGGGVVY